MSADQYAGPLMSALALLALIVGVAHVAWSAHRAESAAKQARESELAAGSARVAAGFAAGWHGGGRR